MNSAVRGSNARDAFALLGAALLSVGCAALITMGEAALFAVVGAFILIGIVASAKFRILFLVFAGIAVFQSSSEVSNLKTGYVIAAGVAILMAAIESARRGDVRSEPRLALVFGCSLLLLVTLATSTLVGVLAGTPPLDAVRDGFPYLLLAASPALGLDAANAFDIPALRGIFATVGLLAGVGFAVNWLNRRGLASLGVERVVLSSLMLCGTLVSYATARIVEGEAKGRTAWIVVASIVSGLVVITGTRAGLLLVLIPVAMFFVASRLTWTQRVIYGFIGLIVGVAAIAAIAFTLLSLTGVDSATLQARFTSIPGLSSNATAIQSFEERGAERRSARDVWKKYPVAGAGAGVQFTWYDAFGRSRSAFTIDSLVSFPAKFGLIGVFSLLLWMWSIARLTIARRRRGGVIAGDALTVFTVFAVAFGLLASPLEEKGLAFGLIMLFALLFAESGLRSGHMGRHRHHTGVTP